MFIHDQASFSSSPTEEVEAYAEQLQEQCFILVYPALDCDLCDGLEVGFQVRSPHPQ